MSKSSPMTHVPEPLLTLVARLEALAAEGIPGRRRRMDTRVLVCDARQTIICDVAGAVSNPVVIAEADLIAALDPATVTRLARAVRAAVGLGAAAQTRIEAEGHQVGCAFGGCTCGAVPVAREAIDRLAKAVRAWRTALAADGR